MGSKWSGRLFAPWGKDIAGYPVYWWTAIASNSPYVITINLSLSWIVFKPKNPLFGPAGICLANILLSLEAPRTFNFTSFTYDDPSPSIIWLLLLPSNWNIGKYITLTFTTWPFSETKVSWPAPIWYFSIVYYVNPLDMI